jgi:nitroreductase
MEKRNPLMEVIRTRRSIRQFRNGPVSEDTVNEILEAGSWAPSGKNNQPWKFAVIRDAEMKGALATMTHYRATVREATVCIAVFLDTSRSYDRTKDVQAVGACLQNMLLAIHSIGLGGVWLGEILKNKEKVAELLGAESGLELMAVIAMGHPGEKAMHFLAGEGPVRKRLDDLVFLRK